MDIKTRIDALTEAEAKAALEWTICELAEYKDAGIDFCVLFYEISEEQKNLTLDDALKESIPWTSRRGLTR